MKAYFFILKTVLLLTACALPIIILPQNNSTSSLLTALNNETTLAGKSKVCYRMADSHVYSNADSAAWYYKLGVKYAIAAKVDTLIANGYYNIARTEAERNNYKPALQYCDSAFKYFQKAGKTIALAMVYNVRGGVNMSSGNNEKAFELYHDALRYAENDTTGLAALITYGNLTVLLNNMKNHTLALEYGIKQYTRAKQLNKKDEIAYACAIITDTYTEMDSLLKAKKYIEELQDAAKGSEDPYLQVMAKNYFGILHFNEKKYQEAVLNYRAALALSIELPDRQFSCNILINLANTYKNLGLLHKADSCFMRAVELSTEFDIKEERKDAYKGVVETAELQKDYQKAFHFLTLFQQLSDSLLNEQSQQALAEAEAKYKSEENEKQITLLNTQKKLQELETEKQAFFKNIILTAMLLFFIIAVLFFNRFKLKKRIETQQVLLKERNRISRDLHDDVGATLSSVKAYSEILKDKPGNPLIAALIQQNASEMIEQLEVIAWAANPGHDTFESLQNKITRYAEPLCHAKNIVYTFSAGNIKTEITIPGEIRQSIYLVAKEAVNNTVKYSGASNCTIHASTIDGNLLIKISDNGKGFEQKTATGNGLANMQSRIKEIGGETVIQSEAGMGTQVTVLLPYPFKIPNTWYRKPADA